MLLLNTASCQKKAKRAPRPRAEDATCPRPPLLAVDTEPACPLLVASKQKKMTRDNRLSDFRKEYKESAKETFQWIPDYIYSMRVAVSLQKSFTIALMRKGTLNNEIKTLFDPDEDGSTPNFVVLKGPAGIGKTMTSKKIMLDWASGDLYQDKFDFVFYLSCREINTILGDISLVGLFSRACRLQSSGDLVSILKDSESQRKLLIIVDGFDELRWTLEEKSEGCPDISMETHKEIILQSLLSRQVLPQSSLIITTRSLAMLKLNTFIVESRNVEIWGFTREDQEEYVHKFYGNKEDADKVLSIIKDNKVLCSMCAVPITCWIVCTVMKQEIRKELSLIRCDTMTSIYLLYLEVLLTNNTKKEPSVRRKQTCLKKLCALANQGVLNQQILFEKNDLERHGLSLDEVESVFLNENIFHWDDRSQTCYSFIHLSVQEFLAALYYGMDDWFGFIKGIFLPKICKGKSLSSFSSNFRNLELSAQFLFGLLNKNQVKTFSEITGIPISLRARSAIKKWAKKDICQAFFMNSIFSLYETQDEDFIRSVMSRRSSLTLFGSDTAYLLMDRDSHRDYSKELNYCLKTLKSESFQSLCVGSLTLDPECQKILSSFLYRSQEVSFRDCTISSKDCPGEDKGKDEESSSEDKMKPADLSFLINPESKIQDLSSTDRTTGNNSSRTRFLVNPASTQLTGHGPALHLPRKKAPKPVDPAASVYNSKSKLLTGPVIHKALPLNSSKNECHTPCFGYFPGILSCVCIYLCRLYGCGLTSSCCNYFHSLLITNRSLTRLHLSGNKLQDSGIKLLCEGLRHPDCTLQELR
ncbi:NACHT, LRR and PYD domains-containing protein 3-like [Rana temporaria]|uniref:NACHT, LRR and PYD domains-containing protein 3-like n=1 Tax=Rana temporaria TaxID=8407 RepID=UPI001AACB1ED|nr:NACHT, LRR and PYD domains-containing protein 3-like [Rana temporaria]